MDAQTETAAPAFPYDPPQVSHAPDAMASPLEEVKDAASEQFRKTTADLKESGSEVLQTAKEAGSTLVAEQKEKIADKIEQYSKALESACNTLREGDANPLVGPASRASQHLHKASDYLRSRDGMDFLHDLGDLARRKPEIFFGGLFVAGLASVRFLKASAGNQRSAPQTNRGTVTNKPSPPANGAYAGTTSPTLRQPILNPNQLK